VLAGILFLGVVSLAAAAIVVTRGETEATDEGEPETPTSATGRASESPEPTAVEPDAAPTEIEGRPPAHPRRPTRSRERTTWTADASSTLEDLGRAWSIPREVLAQLNPDLSAQRLLEAGTKVVVHTTRLEGGSRWALPTMAG
jgi:hypothetical protein